MDVRPYKEGGSESVNGEIKVGPATMDEADG